MLAAEIAAAPKGCCARPQTITTMVSASSVGNTPEVSVGCGLHDVDRSQRRRRAAADMSAVEPSLGHAIQLAAIELAAIELAAFGWLSSHCDPVHSMEDREIACRVAHR